MELSCIFMVSALIKLKNLSYHFFHNSSLRSGINEFFNECVKKIEEEN